MGEGRGGSGCTIKELLSTAAPLTESEKQPTPAANAEAEATVVPAGTVGTANAARSCVPPPIHVPCQSGCRSPVRNLLIGAGGGEGGSSHWDWENTKTVAAQKEEWVCTPSQCDLVCPLPFHIAP